MPAQLPLQGNLKVRFAVFDHNRFVGQPTLDERQKLKIDYGC